MITRKTEQRLRFYWLIIIGLFVIILVRLAMLQLVQAHDYRTQSEENRIRIIPIRAPRGEILDINGIVLAKNKQVFSVTLTQGGISSSQEVIERLAQILGSVYTEITPEYITEQIEAHAWRRYEPILIKRDIDMNMVTRLDEARRELPGVAIEVEPVRDYPANAVSNQPLAGHLLGYVREINAAELKALNQEVTEDEYYQPGDLIGKDGLEKTYQNYLRGLDGARQVEVNTYNRPVGEQVTISAQPGNTLVLTLDANLQQVMEKSIDEVLESLQRQGKTKAKAGAAVALDVKTGAVLAMASRPSLDPNHFIGPMSQETADFYYKSEPHAAINRVIAGTYPPGSTFKPITAMAALESQAVKPEQKLVNCTGAYWIKPYIRCTGQHGNINLYTAIAKSCNTYFQEAGRLAGPERLVMVGQDFGLGMRTGIDIPGEAKGLLPSPQWKRDLNASLLEKQHEKHIAELQEKYREPIARAEDEKTRNELLRNLERERRRLESLYAIDYNFSTSWQPYDTFNMSIGQGNNNYTPLQLANFTATLANGGRHYKPYLVDRIISSQGEIVQRCTPTLLHQVAVSQATMAAVRKGMEGVTQPGGTAWGAFANFPESIRVAAKTGTAQSGRQGDDKKKDYHAVFLAYAPAEDPQIAFAGIIEYGGQGGSTTALVANAVFREYFGLGQEMRRPPTGTNTAPAPVNVPPQNTQETETSETGESLEAQVPGVEIETVEEIPGHEPNADPTIAPDLETNTRTPGTTN